MIVNTKLALYVVNVILWHNKGRGHWPQCYQTHGLGARLGYFWLLRYFWATFTSWPWKNVFKSDVFVKNCQFPVNFPFQRQWADLSSVNRIKTSYGAIVGDYLQLPELDNLSFFCPIGWFLVNLPHKSAQNETVGRILAWWKIGLLLGYLSRPRIKFAGVWYS